MDTAEQEKIVVSTADEIAKVVSRSWADLMTAEFEGAKLAFAIHSVPTKLDRVYMGQLTYYVTTK